MDGTTDRRYVPASITSHRNVRTSAYSGKGSLLPTPRGPLMVVPWTSVTESAAPHQGSRVDTNDKRSGWSFVLPCWCDENVMERRQVFLCRLLDHKIGTTFAGITGSSSIAVGIASVSI